MAKARGPFRVNTFTTEGIQKSLSAESPRSRTPVAKPRRNPQSTRPVQYRETLPYEAPLAVRKLLGGEALRDSVTDVLNAYPEKRAWHVPPSYGIVVASRLAIANTLLYVPDKHLPEDTDALIASLEQGLTRKSQTGIKIVRHKIGLLAADPDSGYTHMIAMRPRQSPALQSDQNHLSHRLDVLGATITLKPGTPHIPLAYVKARPAAINHAHISQLLQGIGEFFTHDLETAPLHFEPPAGAIGNVACSEIPANNGNIL